MARSQPWLYLLSLWKIAYDVSIQMKPHGQNFAEYLIFKSWNLTLTNLDFFLWTGAGGGGGFVTVATIRCERVSHSFSGEVLQWRGLWSGETWWCNQGLPGIELCVCLFTSTCPFLVLNFLNFAFWKIRWLAGLVRCIQSVFRGGEDENQQFIIVFSACHGLYSLNEM